MGVNEGPYGGLTGEETIQLYNLLAKTNATITAEFNLGTAEFLPGEFKEFWDEAGLEDVFVLKSVDFRPEWEKNN